VRILFFFRNNIWYFILYVMWFYFYCRPINWSVNLSTIKHHMMHIVLSRKWNVRKSFNINSDSIKNVEWCRTTFQVSKVLKPLLTRFSCQTYLLNLASFLRFALASFACSFTSCSVCACWLPQKHVEYWLLRVMMSCMSVASQIPPPSVCTKSSVDRNCINADVRLSSDIESWL